MDDADAPDGAAVRLSDVLGDPAGSLRHMEEYVNDGSPSGFSAINQPTPAFRPGSGAGPFPLHACVADAPASASDYLDVPPLPGLAGSNWLYIHPDVRHHPDLQGAGLCVRPLDAPLVRPTSSGRTVQMVGAPGWYLKLSYPALLGRVDRAMPRAKAVAGPEMSREIADSVRAGRLPAALHILPEVGARVITAPGGRSWGQVIRARRPFGRREERIHAMVPVFSLFSTDRRNPDHASLLGELIDHWGRDAELHVVQGLLEPLVECYFALVRCLGLQAEFNAQNVLLGLDPNGVPSGFVLRDLMGAEKDLTIRGQLGLGTDFESAPFKCISRQTDARIYEIRHSLAYDFKLGDYVLAPLISEAAARGGSPIGELTAHVRGAARSQMAALPGDYFPSGCWYRHPKVVQDHERSFERVAHPRFR